MAEGSIRSVVVVGAGVMGRGIALASARAGLKTSVIEPSDAATQSARADLDRILERSREKGELDEDEARATRIHLAADRRCRPMAYGSPRPTMEKVAPMRLDHEGSGSGAARSRRKNSGCCGTWRHCANDTSKTCGS